jgi:hypothetical protein
MIVTGRTERELTTAASEVRAQIAFYASTPSYRPALDVHGWGALGEDLHDLSRQGRWTEMPGLVNDEVLAEFAVIGEPQALAGELTRRYGDLFTRCVLHTPYDVGSDVLAKIARGLRSRGGARAEVGS